MLRNILLTLIIIIATLFAAKWLLNSDTSDKALSGDTEVSTDYARGPHNGRLLEQNGFAVEITIFETGVPPEFRVYPYSQGETIDPENVDLGIELARTGNIVDRFEFTPQGDMLRGDGVVTEPHSFDVTVNAKYQGETYQWHYESHEGRTQIPADLANEAGIKTEIAGPATIIETLKLTGRVEIKPGHISQVRPRFPGIVKNVHVTLGDTVTAGDPMLTVQSNESLQDYTVTAPISGLIIKRNVHPGEVTADEPLFTIADLSGVWVQLDVFTRDTGTVRLGQPVTIQTLDGYSARGSIEWLSPLSNHASQSIHARISLDNPEGRLRPGQFVRAEVGVSEHEVPLAVRRSAIQGFRDFQVVFARFGETYEVRMLEFGLANDEWQEVTGGLLPGTEYVTENSYLIKADIEKSGASHDH
ncbi:MAG: efflux RND transporter periplasmic adaptor subunit [Gammaproteobacteria bacterium]